jgi:hypothetical protein
VAKLTRTIISNVIRSKQKEHYMEYQRVTKSAQKEQSKTPSSSLHRTSLNHVGSHPLLELQRTIGNQAVLNMLRSGNVQIDPTTQAFVEPRFGHDFSQIPIHSMQAAVPQTKLKVNQPGDVYEQEANRVAEQVMRMTDSEGSMSDGEDEAKNSLMRKQADKSGTNAATESSDIPPIVHDVLNSGGGQPLDTTTRAFMEPRFGYDFSRVRVYTDERAAESARAVSARAYTVGRNVIFGVGQYVPRTDEGRQLLAHELTHVVQQWAGRVSIPQGKASQVVDNQSLEAEADELGGRAAHGEPALLHGVGSSPVRKPAESAFAISVQRQVALADSEATGAGPGPVATGTGHVSVYAGETMTSEAALRQIYRQSAREISEEALRMTAQGISVEDAARWAHQARNDLKVLIRARGSPIVRGFAEARNIRKYGNKIGPTFEELIREGKTPEDIIGSAGRASKKLSRVATKLKIGGGFLIAVDLAIVTWEVISAPEGERLRTAVAGGAGVAGAAAMGWAGAKGGAAIGAIFSPVGAAIGGGIGGIGGAIFGGWLGHKTGEKAYDLVDDLVNPSSGYLLDLGTEVIEEEYIRKQAQRRP